MQCSEFRHGMAFPKALSQISLGLHSPAIQQGTYSCTYSVVKLIETIGNCFANINVKAACFPPRLLHEVSP